MAKKAGYVVFSLLLVLCFCCLSKAAETEPNAADLGNILAKVSTYRFGQSRESLTELSDLIRAKSNSSPQDLKPIEKSLVGFLRSNATIDSKQFVCQQLSFIGSEDSVAVLATMLTEKAVSDSNILPSDMARYALERIPSPAADDALRDALGKTDGKVRIGIINSLGQRRDAKSVPVLSSLIYNSDITTADAAAAALGRIANSQATEALAEAKEKISGETRPMILDAYLKCADELVAQGEDARGVQPQAFVIYRQLYEANEPMPIRLAALKGMITVAGESVIVSVLKKGEPQMQAEAIKLVREVPGTEVIKAVSAELPNLSAAGQVQLISALTDRADRAALPAAINAAKSADGSVRMAALSALATLGDGSTIELLSQAAATTRGAEQQAARDSLYSLRGSDIDQTIVANIVKAEPKVKIELIRCIDNRRIYSAVDVLLQTAKDSEPKVRLESIKALKAVSGCKHLPALIDILINAQGASERSEAEKTIAAVANKTPERNRRAETILAVLPSVKEATARCSLLNVLGKIGDANALGVLRETLGDENAEAQAAAIRALSNWPNIEPATDLLNVAQKSTNKVHQVLALRGFVRLTGMKNNRPPEETVKMYRQAIELASEVSEKKMVLAGLANIKSLAALQMAADYLGNKDLQQEAEAAVVKIAPFIRETNPIEAKAALQKVIEITENSLLSEQAKKILISLEK